MKVCIIYESKYGNGKKCVEHLQNIISKKGHDVETSSIREIKPSSLPRADLYIFSTPTHGAKYALMATCMDAKFYDRTKALQIMEALLQPKGMIKVSDGIKIKVTGMKGPLETGYEEKLDAFVKEIL